MNKFLARQVFFLLIIVFFFGACKSRKKATATVPVPAGACSDIKALNDSIQKKQFRFEWLSAKLKNDADLESGKHSFDITLRIRRDSAIWMNITAVGGVVKVAKVLITQDSVKFIKYIGDGEYFIGDFGYINKMLQTDLDYEMIESMLVGNSVEFYQDTTRLRSFNDNGRCALSTVRKRKLRRFVKEKNMKLDSAQTIWMDPATYKISEVMFRDFATKRSFDARYFDFNTPEDNTQLFPYKAEFYITAEKSFSIKSEYDKVNLNKKFSFAFSIPENYKRIQFKENNETPGQQ